jgi:hypothetical protein
VTDNGYPRSWYFGTDDDGLVADGAYSHMSSGRGAYGQVPIAVLAIGGEDRSVWLNTDVLVGQFKAELKRRGERDFNPGERIVITRGAEKKTSQTSGNDYWPYRTEFPDAPNSAAADILGVEFEPVGGAEQPVGGAEAIGPQGVDQDDDDIPF